MSKLDAFLKGLGVPAATVTALKKADEDKDSDLDTAPLIEDFKTAQRKLLENDPEIVSEIARKEQGKILDMVTKKIRVGFNLDSASIKDKKIDEVISMAVDASAKNSDKDLKTVQEENTKLAAQIKKYEDEDIPAIKADVEKQKKTFLINQKLQKKIPVADLRVPIETVDLVLNNQLLGAYDLDMDDKGEVLIFNKGTRLQAQSADKSKLLTLDDVVGETLKKNKFIKESNAEDIDPATGKKKEIQPDKQKDEELKKKIAANPHLKKAMEHEAELKKQSAKA